MKKTILLLTLLLFIPSVLAATVDLQPDAVYETNSADFNISVNNFLGQDVINDILLDTATLEVESVQDFIGWQYDMDSNEIHWFNGTIENNIANAIFIFTSTLPLVDSDQDVTLSGTFTYADSTTEDFTLTLEVLNDDTPPVINNYSPLDYVRANEDNQEITVEVSDPETGIDSVTYAYGECGNLTTTTLSCSDGTCTGTADFSDFDEGDTACFTITATNNAGETETLDGTLEFDGTPPVVNLISPIDGSYAGPGSTFTFRATDNTAASLDCDVFIDDDLVHSTTAANGTDEQFALNITDLEEAMHNWEVSCTDAVGLNDIAIDQFSYDQTPPVITLNSPANGSLISSITIDVSVTDNIGVNSVSYNLPLDTSTWLEGENILTVDATDKANNAANAEFVFYVDRTAPTITVLSPVNASTFDYNAVFSVRVDDTYDSELECTLDTDVTSSVTENVASGVVSNISLVLPLGDFTWFMTCVDDAGNSATTSNYYGTAIDTSGPIIEIQDVRYVVRGNDLEINARITDASGVDIASASFEGSTISLSNSGDDYTGTFAVDSNATLGTYTYTVTSNDTNGYESTESDEFEIIEGYVITLNLPNQVAPGATISASGSVVQDDNTIPSGNVTLEYHDTAVLALDSQGEFSHSFTAPGAAGTYTVRVLYETSRFIYTLEKTYRVVNPQAGGGGGTSDGWGVEVLPYEYTPPPVQEDTDGGQNLEDEEASASELITEDEPIVQEPTVLPPEEPRAPLGAGQATGILNALGRAVKWWILLLALMALVIGLILANRKLRKPKSGDKINWDGYFD